jgi:hypothetical protein
MTDTNPTRCAATSGTYRCGRDEHDTGEHATVAGIIDGRRVRVLRWGVNGERWSSIDALNVENLARWAARR